MVCADKRLKPRKTGSGPTKVGVWCSIQAAAFLSLRIKTGCETKKPLLSVIKNELFCEQFIRWLKGKQFHWLDKLFYTIYIHSSIQYTEYCYKGEVFQNISDYFTSLEKRRYSSYFCWVFSRHVTCQPHSQGLSSSRQKRERDPENEVGYLFPFWQHKGWVIQYSLVHDDVLRFCLYSTNHNTVFSTFPERSFVCL